MGIGFIDFHISSPFAARDSCAEPELLKELYLCLLHTHGGFGVAVRLGDAPERVGS